MRTHKHYLQLPTRCFWLEYSHCPICQTFLCRSTLLSRRTIITLDDPLCVAH